MSKDLLREAIADAKAVRETAIANAKLALEEAFTPKLQSMLSTKIAEEMEDELEDEEVVEMDGINSEEEEVSEMDHAMSEEELEMGTEDELEVEDEVADEEVPMEGSYAEGEMGEEEPTEEGVYEEEEAESEEDLELEAIIKELEGDDAVEVEVEDEEEEAPVAEANKMDEDEEEEVMDLEEIIRTLTEEDEEEVEVEEEEESSEVELEEAYKTIRSLKNTINEVNLLNSKLLFSNKLFRANSLSESQKMNVIETFDRANSVREVKLVYSTLAESLTPKTAPKKRRVSEGLASRSTNSTKPSKSVIVESNQFATRMQKLAGLK